MAILVPYHNTFRKRRGESPANLGQIPLWSPAQKQIRQPSTNTRSPKTISTHERSKHATRHRAAVTYLLERCPPRRSKKFQGRAFAGKEARRIRPAIGEGERPACRLIGDAPPAAAGEFSSEPPCKAGDGERDGRCGTGANKPLLPPPPPPPRPPLPSASRKRLLLLAAPALSSLPNSSEESSPLEWPWPWWWWRCCCCWCSLSSRPPVSTRIVCISPPQGSWF